MINRLIDVFVNMLRDSLYLLANHWILTLVGITLLVWFSPLILRFIYSELGYILWRTSGSLGRLLRSENKESAWQYFGLSNPHVSSIESGGRFVANLTLLPGQTDSSQDIVLGESVELIRSDSSSAQTNTQLQTVAVEFKKFFPVNPKRIRRGCHGRYSLAKSIYLGMTFGGDPICGGGLKNFTPPRWKQVLEFLRLNKLLKNKNVSAWIYENENGSSGVFYKDTWDKKGPVGYLHFLVGDEAMINQYAEKQKITIKPIQIVFA